MIRRLGWLLWPAGVVLGFIAERVATGFDDPRQWIPDLAVGWILIACGLIATAKRPRSVAGPLMAAAGFTWFFPNFAGSGTALSWVGARTLYLHRGPLLHLILAYPTGRLPSWLLRTSVAVGYATAFMTPLWRSDAGAITLSLLLVSVSAFQYLRTVGRARRARLLALAAASAFAVAVGGYALLRLTSPTETVTTLSILAYQIALGAIAVGLLAGLVSAPWERSAVTDLVVELGEAGSGSLRHALARSLGDSTLEVGYWLPEADAFVDPTGSPIVLPEANSERAVTMVKRDGEPVAVLVHDPAVLDDPGLLEAVSSATQLAAANARLQAELRARVEDLTASRRRILEAGDEERRRLERRLHLGAQQRLVRLGETVTKALDQANGISSATLQKIGRAQEQLGGTLDGLKELARGLHPRAVADLGLDRALALLAERSPVPVDLEVQAGELPPATEAAVYFLCSEALANVAKYASATRAGIRVETINDALRVTVQDDGSGGAQLSGGTGMLGLADRMEALGGSFQVKSPIGQGTRLIAEIPLQRQGLGMSTTPSAGSR